MNTNNHCSLWDRDGNAVTELLWVIASITIAIPLLSIVFDTNRTASNQGLEGILVREMAVSENGLMAIVNLNKTRPHFEKTSNLPDSTKSQRKVQKQSGDEPLAEIEELISIEGGEWNFDTIKKLAGYYKIDPLLMSLPAARMSFLEEPKSSSETSFNRVQSLIQQGTVEQGKSLLPNGIPVAKMVVSDKNPPTAVISKLSEAEFQSAKDFVSGLINQSYAKKNAKSKIFGVSTNPVSD